MSPFDFDVKSLIGFLPERPCYTRWMTIKQFLAYHHSLSGGRATDRGAEIKRVMSLVDLDIDIRRTKIKELSRGMLQRIGLAQALIGRPRICFFDEPTSGMDPLGFILMRKLLLKCKEEGMTIVLNSHHLQEVEKVYDRVAFIRRGKIEEISRIADSAALRQSLVLSWLPNPDADTSLALGRAAEHSGCALIDTAGDTARFSVPGNEKAADIVSSLAGSGLRVYQSRFERRELMELFLSELPVH